MNTLKEALGMVFAMGAVILFCRAFPFLFFSRGGNSPGRKDKGPLAFDAGSTDDSKKVKKSNRRDALFSFVEKTVPPVAMTVLAFNALGTSFRDNPRDGLLVLAASVFTALVHIWKQNPLISIFGGTALYMILSRVELFGNFSF